MDLLTPDAALLLADRYWRIHGDISVLPSYADQNYRIRAQSGDYVLKVAHPEWSRMDLDLENQAMMALAEREPALELPRVQPTVQGEHLLTLPVAGQRCHVRVLSFVPGTTYADAIGKVPMAQRQGLHQSLGSAVGRLTRGLQGFSHSAADRRHDWNLMRMPSLRSEIAHIDDAHLCAIVRAQVEAFVAHLPQWRAQLPITVLHNDANDLNVIVAERGGEPRVSAVIDFGDMCTSFRLADLAIACTYAMQHETDPVGCAQEIVRGYVTQCPLLRVELERLQTFILARLCHSVLMATRAHRKAPDNPFIMVSQRGVRALLRHLAGLDRDAIAAPFLEQRHD
jgi:Ser/Thr protein kinase RdoA (MazF antagonist)